MKKKTLTYRSPSPLKAYAIVDKRKPVLRVNDIFREKDIEVDSNEKIIEVIITAK